MGIIDDILVQSISDELMDCFIFAKHIDKNVCFEEWCQKGTLNGLSLGDFIGKHTIS